MAGKSGGLKGLLGSFVEVTPDPEKKPQSTTTTPAPSASGVARQPVTVDSIADILGDSATLSSTRTKTSTKAPPSPASANIERLLNAIQEKIPPDNALIRLRNAEEPLKAAIPDAAVRRQAALGVLKSTQGITDESIRDGSQQIARIIDEYLGHMTGQLEQMRTDTLPGKRAQAQSLRDQTTTIDQQIEKLTAQKQELLDEATQIEGDVSALEAKLATFEQELTAARAAAYAALCPDLA